MRKIYILLIFSMLILPLALAESLIDVATVYNEISPADQAKYRVTITNDNPGPQRYSVYSFVQGWNVDPSPIKDRIIDIAARKKYSTIIVAHPTEDFPPGIYTLPIVIESDSGERFNQLLKVYLRPDEPIDYLPAIKVGIDINDKITPKNTVPVTLTLENRNPLDLTGLKVKIQRDIPEFVKEGTVDLPPLQTKTIQFTIKPNEFQQPKDYTIFFVFERDGEAIKVIEKQIEIVTILSDFAVSIKQESVFLKRFIELSIMNDGNVINTQEVKYPVSLWTGLLTKSDAKLIKEGGQRYLVWEVALGPSESTTANFVLNYRLPFYFGVILLLAIIFYFLVQSPVVVKKHAVTINKDDEGALSEIKITLEVMNKSNKNLKDVLITDLVPSIANVEKSLELGTLKPQQVRHTKRGTKVIWSLAELDGHEHRLITYKLRAKLNILGTFKLPRAALEYKGKRGKKRKAYSNVFQLRSDVTE